MFYGTYEGCEGIDVAIFKTRQELEDWIAGKDEFTKHFHSILRKKEWKNKRKIKQMLSDPKTLHTTDEDGISWMLFRP